MRILTLLLMITSLSCFAQDGNSAIPKNILSFRQQGNNIHTHLIEEDIEIAENENRYHDYWYIPSGDSCVRVDEYSYPYLIDNDFYGYISDKVDTQNLESPLSRKKFEASDDYANLYSEYKRLRQIVLNDTIYQRYYNCWQETTPQYDINNGRFVFWFQDLEFPESVDSYNHNNGIVVPKKYLPHFRYELRMWKGKKSKVYYNEVLVPIKNEDIALEIERSNDYFDHDKATYRMQIFYRYINGGQKKELVDIVLYQIETNYIVWSLTGGDNSDLL